MKAAKLLIFSIFILGSFYTNAQNTYHPLLKFNTRWYVQGYNQTTAHTFLHYISLDTIINGKIYSKYIDPMTSDSVPLAYLREDTMQRRVWIYDFGSGQEQILYDFTLETGDSISIDFADKGGGAPATGYYKVTAVDSVQTLQGWRRALRLSNPDFNLNDPRTGQNILYWIEGVGSTIGPVYSQYLYTVLDADYTRFRTLCAFQGQTHVYALIHEDTCTINVGGTNISEENNTGFAAKVTGEDFSRLQLNLQQPANVFVNVYDVQGRQVFGINKNLNAGQTVLPLQFSSAKNNLYFVKIEAVTKQGVQQKTIKILK